MKYLISSIANSPSRYFLIKRVTPQSLNNEDFMYIVDNFIFGNYKKSNHASLIIISINTMVRECELYNIKKHIRTIDTEISKLRSSSMVKFRCQVILEYSLSFRQEPDLSSRDRTLLEWCALEYN